MVLVTLFLMFLNVVYVCVHPCVCVYMLMPPCVCAGVRAYPPVCVCTLLGSARELTDTEKTPIVAEETDIDADEVNQVPAAEELNINRGVTDLDATAKTPDLNHSEHKVFHATKPHNQFAENLLISSKNVGTKQESCSGVNVVYQSPSFEFSHSDEEANRKVSSSDLR